MRRRATPWLITTTAIALMSCGLKEDEGVLLCSETCDKLYLESECDIQSPGRTVSELLDTCNTNCLQAWETPCSSEDCLSGYDPYTDMSSGVSVELQNQPQAELWMDCVRELECADLTGGYCAPIW